MILCCGEALIDMLPRDVDGTSMFAPHAGGAVFNTAIALGRLGAPSGYYGGVSTDLFGEVLARELAASHVDMTRAARSERPTTLAFVTLTNGQAKYAFYDENTAGRMLHASDLPDLTGVEGLFFGGISLVSTPAADAYATLCVERSGDLPVMIDPNVRPSFITDATGYRARLDRMLGRADAIKISDEDMDWLGTSPETLLSGGAAVVLVTRGEEGVDVITSEGTKRVPATKATVVDTVGAGDTFNAGFLAGLSQGGLMSRVALRAASLDALAPAADLGARAAAVTVSRAGANPPWANEL